MASEIRVDKINSLSGVGTVTLSPTGVDISGITTAATLKATTGIVTTLTATTGIVTTFVTNTAKVGAAVTISESGIEASGIGITCANINGTQIGGRRNIIINGDQRVAQRGSAAVTVDGNANYRSVDRFKTDIDNTGNGDWSHGQSTDVPTGQGFTNSSKITVVTQASQPSGTSTNHEFYTMLEKQDVAHLEWGTSAAKTCTISFWVKSSVTGTYSFFFRHYAPTTYTYYTSYTINSADTWEKKVITVTGHTSGGNVSGTTDVGLLFMWSLGNSSGNETGTLNEWTTSDTRRAPAGSVYLPENSGATWYITGVQFEVGSQATPFEHRSFGEELSLCQRYCYVIKMNNGDYSGFVGQATSADAGEVCSSFPVPMRDQPDYTGSATNCRFQAGNSSNTVLFSALSIYRVPIHRPVAIIGLRDTDIGSMTQGQALMLQAMANNGKMTFDAEL